MPGSVARAASCLLIVASMGGWLLGASTTTARALVANGSSSIEAMLCETSSAVSITSPVSDSVVTTSTIPLAGGVSQANQLEVYIDNVFDHVIPLTPTQTSFIGSVHLTAGTHTIKVVAIDACAGTNGTAQVVVTYQPPEEETTPTGSSGAETPTTAGGVYIGETISESSTPATSGKEEVLLPLGVMAPLLEWLNIKTVDAGETEGLSVWRAVMIGAGMYLLTIGVATVVVQSVATLPTLQAMLPSTSPILRNRWVARGFRLLGIPLILAALFL